MDFLNDEEIAAMEQQYQSEAQQGQSAALAPPPPVPLYDPAQVPVLGTGAPNGQPAPNGAAGPGGIFGMAKRQWGPMPAWAWLLLGGSVAGAGYLYFKNGKSSDKSKDDEPKVEPKLGQRVPVTANSGSSEASWRPSRSEFAEQLQRYFDTKGLAPHVVVWHDAEDARDKGKMRIISPLVNVQVKDAKAVKVDAALKRWARRQGLDPRPHQDGSFGFYPHTGKRGKEWERYIDDLRDDGQTV